MVRGLAVKIRSFVNGPEINEKPFHSWMIHTFLPLLKWDATNGLVSKPNVQMGSSTKEIDIGLKNTKGDIVVLFELKKPKSASSKKLQEGVNQSMSYSNQLPHIVFNVVTNCRKWCFFFENYPKKSISNKKFLTIDVERDGNAFIDRNFTTFLDRQNVLDGLIHKKAKEKLRLTHAMKKTWTKITKSKRLCTLFEERIEFDDPQLYKDSFNEFYSEYNIEKLQKLEEKQKNTHNKKKTHLTSASVSKTIVSKMSSVNGETFLHRSDAFIRFVELLYEKHRSVFDQKLKEHIEGGGRQICIRTNLPASTKFKKTKLKNTDYYIHTSTDTKTKQQAIEDLKKLFNEYDIEVFIAP